MNFLQALWQGIWKGETDAALREAREAEDRTGRAAVVITTKLRDPRAEALAELERVLRRERG